MLHTARVGGRTTDREQQKQGYNIHNNSLLSRLGKVYYNPHFSTRNWFTPQTVIVASAAAAVAVVVVVFIHSLTSATICTILYVQCMGL